MRNASVCKCPSTTVPSGVPASTGNSESSIDVSADATPRRSWCARNSRSGLLIQMASAGTFVRPVDRRPEVPQAARHVCLQFVYSGLMPADTTTVRVRRPDSERLQSLARSRHAAVIDVVHAAIDALERQEFLRALNGDHQRLRNDPALWEQYVAERHEWDALA